MIDSPSRPRLEEPAQLFDLPAGVRLLVLPAPLRHTVSLSVYVRVGSVHERRSESGLCHVVEHMVFKGTATRDAARINFDAERLGAEANAHTDKDHTAFHMRGRPEDAGRLLRQLADLVRFPSFPEDELEREREVLLQEMDEVDDDPMATAYRLLDRSCYGQHSAAQAVIGNRRQVERFTREDLQRWIARHFTGHNIVVAATGPIDPQALARQVEAAFAGIEPGTPSEWSAPAWLGAVRTRRLPGGGQAHLVLGLPVAALTQDDVAPEMAALLLGEGMSSPLMAELRERRALAYYAACSADRFAHCGQLTIEVSTAPRHVDEVIRQLWQLLQRQAGGVERADLTRARHQFAVRLLRTQEGATRKLEAAALELLARGTLHTPAHRWAQVQALTGRRLQQAFERMLEAAPALAIVGAVPRGAGARARELLGR